MLTFQEFEKQATSTLGQNYLGGSLWSVLCGDDVFEVFREVHDKYMEAEIPDANGTMGNKNQRKEEAINANAFRCFMGLEDPDI